MDYSRPPTLDIIVFSYYDQFSIQPEVIKQCQDADLVVSLGGTNLDALASHYAAVAQTPSPKPRAWYRMVPCEPCWNVQRPRQKILNSLWPCPEAAGARGERVA